MPRIVSRDLEIARFLGRVKIAKPEHVSTRFGLPRTTTYRRLNALIESDLAAASDRVSLDGRVYLATRSGLTAGELDLPVADPTPGLAAHDLAATELVSSLEREGVNVDCLTEREMRGLQRQHGHARYLFNVNDTTAGKRIRHLGDVAIEVPGRDRFYVVEIEMVAKTARRWRDILEGYLLRLDLDGFAGVLYVCSERAKTSKLERVGQEVGLGKRIAVLTLEDDPMVGLKALVDATP